MERILQPNARELSPGFDVAILDRAGIAARLRGLLCGQHSGNLSEIAALLGVEELSLRMSVDSLSPHPTVDVMTAVIHHFGVDPTWLLTGIYNPTTHRAAAEGLGSVTGDMRAALERRPTPVSNPPMESFRRHDQN